MALIGITSCRKIDDYAQSVRHYGGEVRVLDRDLSVTDALRGIDGLMLTGGADVEPRRYGQPPHPSVVDTDPVRDEFELGLVAAARRRDLPLLAICRGMQVLNVAQGGTLVQDIPSQAPSNLRHRLPVPPHEPFEMAHEIRVEPGTVLARLLRAQLSPKHTLAVNSRHHQSIAHVADAFRVSATSPDGIIEAMEDPRARFCVAVQWHPEHFWKSGEFEGLFRGLLTASEHEPKGVRARP